MTTCPGCEQEVYADLLDDGRLRCRSCGETDEPAAFQDPMPSEDRVLTDGGSTAVNLSALTADVGGWAEENFGDADDIYRSMQNRHWRDREAGADLGALFCTLGVNEEAGELTHSVLKRAQGVRLDEEGVGAAAEMDAVGDIVVYLADFCYRRGFDLNECVRRAWDGEVSDREWDSETRADSEGSA